MVAFAEAGPAVAAADPVAVADALVVVADAPAAVGDRAVAVDATITATTRGSPANRAGRSSAVLHQRVEVSVCTADVDHVVDYNR